MVAGRSLILARKDRRLAGPPTTSSHSPITPLFDAQKRPGVTVCPLGRRTHTMGRESSPVVRAGGGQVHQAIPICCHGGLMSSILPGARECLTSVYVTVFGLRTAVVHRLN